MTNRYERIRKARQALESLRERCAREAERRRAAMTDRYENIRQALAMGPTPGPWELKDGRTDTVENAQGYPVCTVHWHPDERYGHGVRAAYIAACDPDTIRALLDERDALVKLVMEMRGTLRDLRIRLHAAGRRPEECYEMSMIDDALDLARAAIDLLLEQEAGRG